MHCFHYWSDLGGTSGSFAALELVGQTKEAAGGWPEKQYMVQCSADAL